MIEYPKYKKVLFCTDFSKNSDCAFDYAFGIAKRDESVLYIMHVIPSSLQQDAYLGGTYISEEQWNKIHENIRKDLDRQYNDHYLSKIKDKSKIKIITKSGSEDEQIIEFVQKEKIDLIVIGTHERTGIGYVLLGNIAEKIIRRSPIPVFIIPCRENPGRDKSK
jgi:nucleotide-binding universal stress UspA family protein